MRLTVVSGLCATSVAFDGGNKPAIVVEDPTEPALDTSNMGLATYQNYERSNARCGAESVGYKSCWVDDAGESFSFGCLPDDERVYQQACSAGCEECDSQWRWASENQNTCYDDGELYYQYYCGIPEASAEEEEAVDEEPVSTTKSCAALGWPLQPGDLSVCGYSRVNNGECGSGNFASAQAMCAAAGGRLCTESELLNDETKGTGCKGDCEYVWTSESCTTGAGEAGHIEAAGAKKCEKRLPAQCIADTVVSSVVRCCADVDGSEEKVDSDSGARSFPAPYTKAIAKDYKFSDGNCGVQEPIAEYNCWTNPADKISMRFACSDDDDFVYHQFCGTSPTCDPASCTGEWATTTEVVGQCFSRPSEGYLYHYECPLKRR